MSGPDLDMASGRTFLGVMFWPRPDGEIGFNLSENEGCLPGGGWCSGAHASGGGGEN